MNSKRLNLLQLRVIKFAVFYFIIFAILGGGFVYIEDYKSSLDSQNMQLQGEVSGIQSTLVSIDLSIKEVTEANKIWDKVKGKQKMEGLNIDEAKFLIKQLEKHYFINSPPQVSLSAPTELINSYKTDGAVIMSSKVNLKFFAYSDELVFGFLDSLYKNFPGFVKFKSFLITRTSELNSDKLSLISQGKEANIVQADIHFEWQDFKSIVNNAVVNPIK